MAHLSVRQNEAPITCKTWHGSGCFFIFSGQEVALVKTFAFRDCWTCSYLWFMRIHEVDFCLMSFSILFWSHGLACHYTQPKMQMFCRSSQGTSHLYKMNHTHIQAKNASINCIPNKISKSIEWKHRHLNHVHYKFKRLYNVKAFA